LPALGGAWRLSRQVTRGGQRRNTQITPARGNGNQATALGEQDASPCHVSMTWAQRLKRVFHIDIETCIQCGGAVKIIACIEDPMVIEKILTHLNLPSASTKPAPRPESRAPPQAVTFPAFVAPRRAAVRNAPFRDQF
jgi:hypothetical protein